ncbi:MAG: MarR family winged helix-turn-helix transcriptional regulator [Cellulomonadaceae bacterium]
MSASTEPTCSDRLGFLLAKQGQAMNLRLRQALGASDLGPRHGATLLHLALGGATSQQALIDALGVDPSGLVAILNELESGGLVERRRDPADRRRHIVQITSGGREAAALVESAVADVERVAFADLSLGEISVLGDLLGRIRGRHEGAVCDDA